jgi:hypothetical protein
MPTLDVINAENQLVTINTVPPVGLAVPANSLPVTSGADGPSTSTPLVGTVSTVGTVVLGPFIPQLSRQMWLTINPTVTATGSAQVLRSAAGGPNLAITQNGVVTASHVFTSSATIIANEPLPYSETDATAEYFVSVTLTSGTVAVRLAQ